MRIAILGAGNVGAALARGWAADHEIRLGVRDTSKPSVVTLAASLKATVSTPREACEGADVIVLATPFAAAKQIVEDLGDLGGRILVDATNPLNAELSGLVVSGDTSAGEEIQKWAPAARVVKAFNTTGSGNMENPNYEGGKPAMFICGNDEGARKTVSELAASLGFDVHDAGDLTSARWLEPTAMLWIKMAVHQGMGPDFAFGVLRR